MASYCNTCGHIMDRHRQSTYRKGSAPCGSKTKSGLCTCRGFVRVPPKAEKSERKKDKPKDKAEDYMDAPPPKINE